MAAEDYMPYDGGDLCSILRDLEGNYEGSIDYGSHKPRTYCKYCGEGEVHWVFTDRWILFNADSTPHRCLTETNSQPNCKDETKHEEVEMQNHMVELLLENFYTVGIRFKNSTKTYTYKVAKDIELTELEDQVIVETNSGLEIVDVVRVDDGMNIDLSSDVKYKFIVQKVDRTQYDELCDKDKNVAGVIAKGAAEAKRKELVEQFTGALDEEQIKMLEDVGVEAIKRL